MPDRPVRTVMIVDGSATMLYYHGVLLKRLEYTVQTANAPEIALKIMEHMRPSLVLTAVSFPSMSGVDFIDRIKSTELLKTISVIVLTADAGPSIRKACLDAGAAAYLVKPVDPGLLYRTIQAAVETTPRENIRISTSLKVKAGQSNPEHPEWVSMISAGGAYVRTLAPRPKNEVIPLTILVNGREITVTARVLYTQAIGQGAFQEPGMGLKFIEISEPDRNYLRSYINDRLTSDIDAGPSDRKAGVVIDMA